MKLGLLVQQQVMPINRGLPPLAALGILAGFMALGAWLAAAHVTRPIRELRAAAARIAEGGHVKRLEIDTRDEVSALASDFNKMAEIIAQREKELTDKNAELARSSELKSQFLATVSHELRTPLTAIVGYCQVLKDGLQGPVTDGQTEVLQRIALQAEGLVHQINQLLDVTRIEAGRMELALERVVLAEAVEQAYKAVEPSLKQKWLRFDLEMSGDPVVVAADFERLRQVFTNLLSNAVKFTEKGGITVTIRTVEGVAEVVVDDTGCGIPREQQETIFEEFRQADEGARRKHGGSGLGLAIARRIVEMHDGTLTVASEPGVGATITVRIPIKTEASRPSRLETFRASRARAACSWWTTKGTSWKSSAPTWSARDMKYRWRATGRPPSIR